MQQYFIDKMVKVNDYYELDDACKHHLIRVLRMRKDDCFYLVDSCNIRYLAVLIDENKAFIKEEIKHNSEMPIRVKIIQAFIKKDKFDYFLMKSCELGVDEIIPMTSARTIVKMDDIKANKLERWNKICFEACCQSKRNKVVHVQPSITLKQCIEHKSELNLVAYEDLNFTSSKLRDVIKNQTSITLVIGPEGGFELSEIQYLQDNGFISLGLGPRILRAETASAYALSVVSGLCE
ncbi:MAG: RsmE family RNA methyltransferase [Erysipelotrichaceae bacterium]